MKLGIVSDSHGDIDELIAAYYFIEEQKCSHFVHLGDNLSDLKFLEKPSLNIISVPGTRDEGYNHAHIRVLAMSILSRKISFCHVKEDAPTDSDIIFFGHTHMPAFYCGEGVLYINPGHITLSKRRFPVSTFCIAELDDAKFSAEFFTTELNHFDKKEFYF